jgi:hypothetical protein
MAMRIMRLKALGARTGFSRLRPGGSDFSAFRGCGGGGSAQLLLALRLLAFMSGSADRSRAWFCSWSWRRFSKENQVTWTSLAPP